MSAWGKEFALGLFAYAPISLKNSRLIWIEH